jgi:hypothetical protein
MLTITEDFELFCDEVSIAELERRAQPYQVSVYKNIAEGYYEVVYDNGTPLEGTVFDFIGSVEVPYDISLATKDKRDKVLKHLYEKVDQLSEVFKSNFSTLEKDSWQQQEAEARALLAVSTPLLDELAAARNYSRDELARKIIENAEAARSFVQGF